MRRIALLTGLLFVVLFSCAFSVKEWQESIYHQIKSETIKGLEDAFRAKVSVGKVEGILVGQVLFHDVVVPDFARVKKIYVNYNLATFALRRDIVPAITTITFIDGEFEVKRKPGDRISAVELLPPEDPKAPPPPPFRAKLVFKDCRINYQDLVGFRRGAGTFSEQIYGVEGSVSFQRKDRIDLDLYGKIAARMSPTEVRVSGSTDLKTGKYAFNISADRLDLAEWGNYTVPIEDLAFAGGEADLAVKLSSPQKKGWPLSVVGNLAFHNGKAEWGEYKIEKTYGDLSIADDSLALTNFRTELNGVPFTLNGRFFDFAKQNLDLKVALKDFDLKKMVSLFPQSKDLDLAGTGEAELALTGTVLSPAGSGTLSIRNGNFYDQDFEGKASLSFKENLLKIEVKEIAVYQGKLLGDAEIDFSRPMPALRLKARFGEIDLAAAAQNSPGIEGRADGELELFGPLNYLRGELSARSKTALLFGQPIEDLSSTFSIKDGDIEIKDLSAASQNAAIYSSGMITRDLTFDLQARAQGIRLSGEGILGKMKVVVNRFQGKVGWKLDEEFFAFPLKNLNASGEVILTQGKIGEQEFDLAQGGLIMGEGLIQIENVIFNRKSSVLQASGQTGIGYPTRLKISGENIDLSDLKILNHILPAEAKDPTGQADIKIVISGEIPPESRITSLDPLLDLNASGEVTLKNAEVAEIAVTSARLNLLWQDRKLSFPRSTLTTARSNLTLDLALEDDNRIKASGEGILDFTEFKHLTVKYGRIEGILGVNFIVEGKTDAPQVAASLWLSSPQFNTLSFDYIEGSLSFADNQLILEKPARIVKGSDEFEITGLANLEGMFKNQPEETYLDFDLKVIKADLSSTIALYNQIQGELSRKIYLAPVGDKARIDRSKLFLPDLGQFIRRNMVRLYSANGVKRYFLKEWKESSEEMKKEVMAAPQESLGGKLDGKAALRGKIKKLSGDFEVEVKNGFFRNYAFENLKAKASLLEDKLKIERLELTKRGGTLVSEGEIGFDGSLMLDISTRKLPLDILQIFFDKNFEGSFSMNAALSGPVQNPTITASFMGDDISLADVSYDRLALSLTKRDREVQIQEFSLIEGSRISTISGSFETAPDGKIDLEADLEDNALGLLNLFTNDVQWKKGKASAAVRIKGTPEKPEISGKISLRDTVLYVRVIDSDIKEIKGEAEIKDNLLTVSELTGIWQGTRTKDHPNFIGLAGTLDLSKAFAPNGMVFLNLSFSPIAHYVDLPNLYTGVLEINEARLYGPLHFDLSRGPTLSGKADISNAVITLAQKRKGEGKPFPLNLDLILNLKKNSYAVMGDIATFDLSNIFMNLELRSDELEVSGSLATPSLLGKIFLRRGTVTIFNREFSLLTPELQQKYYPYQSEKIMQNVAVFTGETGEEGIMPDVALVAKVDVENVQEDAEGNITREKVIILSRLKGVIGAVEKERRLDISFDSFKEDENKELKPAGYSEQDIKVMLLPDFIKSLTGISKGEEVDTNVVVADYLASRVQTFIFRGLERELEQTLGLESLTLEYNFGKDVRQAMGVKETRLLEGEKPDWRVGFVKGFFDKFYLDVNYARFGSETEIAEETFNYQLTYKLSRIWSIIYYREPISLQELTSGFQKVTLKAGFSFW